MSISRRLRMFGYRSARKVRHEFVLATFNLCAPPGGYRAGELRAWADRARELPEHLEEIDVLLAQEAGGTPDDVQYEDAFPSYVTEPTNSYGGLRGVYRAFEETRRHLMAAGLRTGRAGSDGRWVFWRDPMWSPTGIQSDDLPSGYWLLDHGAQRPRAVAYQALRHVATGIVVVFVNPHLEFLPGQDGERIRLAQTRDMLARTEGVVEGLRRQRTRVLAVVAGDFGAGLAAESTRPRRSELESAGFRDARDAAATVEDAELSTSKSWDPVLGAWGPRASQNHVDQIWVPPAVDVREWRHHHQNVFKPISDHDMISARLVLPDKDAD